MPFAILYKANRVPTFNLEYQSRSIGVITVRLSMSRSDVQGLASYRKWSAWAHGSHVRL